MVSPSIKRRAIKLSVERGLGRAASACRALGLARSSFYRRGRESPEKCRVRKEVVELSGKHPRYGYRRITALDAAGGFEVNAKRVARIRRQEGLKVSNRQRRMRRLGSRRRSGSVHSVLGRCGAGIRGGPDREWEPFPHPHPHRLSILARAWPSTVHGRSELSMSSWCWKRP